MDSTGCREILFNCLMNLKSNLEELYEQERKKIPTEGEKQLVDPSSVF